MNTLPSPKSCALVAVVILLVIVATVPAFGTGPPSDESNRGSEEGAEKFSFLALDDFDGKLRLNWQPVRHDPTHVSLSKNPGTLTITTQRGSIHGDEKKDTFGEGIQAKNIFLIDNPLSKDMDFVATTCVSGFTPVTPYQQAGLIVYNDDDNYIKWGYEYNWPQGEGQVLCILSETDAKSDFRYVESPSGLRRYWLRLTKRGTRYEYAFSTDGKEFKVHGEKEWGDGSPKKIGILAKNGGNKQAAELDACFEFFELRSPAPVPGKGDKETARDYYERGLKRETAKQFEEALADYEVAAALDPGLFDAHFLRSSLRAKMKDYRAAIDALAASLKARPKDYPALFNSGLYYEYLREYDDAIAHYTQALADDADFSHFGGSKNEARAHAHHYRGRVYQWYKQDNAKAVADYTEALRLNPDIERVRYRRARAYYDLKEYAKANADFAAAHKLDPDHPNLLNAWAWLLATCPDARFRDGQLALQLAQKTPDMDTRAAAYAETGAFDDAVAAQKRAIEQLDREPEPGDQKAMERRKERKMQMQTRLAAYEAKQPYRD